MPELATAVGDTTTGQPVSAEGTPPASDNGSVPETRPTSTDAMEGATPFQRTMREELATRSANGHGAIPEARHKEILENARREAGEQALAEWKAKHGWAESVPEEHRQTVQSLFERYGSDPLRLAQEISAKADPAAIRSWAARVLGEGRQRTPAEQPAAQADPMPQPDLAYENQRWYSSEQAIKLAEWNKREALRETQHLMKPLLDERAARLEQEREADQQRQAGEFASRHFETVKTLPHFETHKAEIVTAFRAMPFKTNEDIVQNLHKAYYSVVLPKLEAATTQKVIANLDAKARATTTHPNRGTVATPTAAPASFKDVMKEEMAKLAGQRS